MYIQDHHCHTYTKNEIEISIIVQNISNRILFRYYLIDTNIIANIKYFPSNGTTNDVGGIISTTSRKNTWRLIKIEIDRVT